MVMVRTKLAKLGPSYKKQTYFFKNDNICYFVFWKNAYEEQKPFL